MSHAAETDDPSTVARPGVAPGAAIPPGSSTTPWAWAAVGCLVLGASGVIQTVQERRHSVEKSFVETCPFPLNRIPSKLGIWRLKDGGDQVLDSLTMRVTGGTDHFLRTYVDELTGVSLVVLLLYGPAEPVLPHVPEVCYPANGYSGAQDSFTRKLDYTAKDAGGREVTREAYFRSSVYEKPGGLTVRREEAYHSFRLEGIWSPDVGSGRKFPRRTPGVFKLQIQRSVVPGENRDNANPIDQFLAELIPEIERRIDSASRQGQVAGR